MQVYLLTFGIRAPKDTYCDLKYLCLIKYGLLCPHYNSAYEWLPMEKEQFVLTEEKYYSIYQYDVAGNDCE